MNNNRINDEKLISEYCLDKNTKTLAVVIPKLFNTGLSVETSRQIPIPSMPCFTKLLSKASAGKTAYYNPYYSYLSLLFQHQSISPRHKSNTDTATPTIAEQAYDVNFPLASYLFSDASQSLHHNSYQWVYCVSPIYLHADMTKLVLSKDLSNDLSIENSIALCDFINHYFDKTEKDKTWNLHFDKKLSKIFLLSELEVSAESTPISYKVGEVLRSTTSKEHNEYWSQTLTEIQMLLHSSSINSSRVQLGMVPVNGLWIWGGGNILDISNDTNNVPSAYWQQVCTNNQDLENLADSMGIKTQLINDKKTTLQSHSLIYLEQIEQAIREKDIVQVLSQLSFLEEHIFAPVLHMLSNKQLDDVILVSDANYYRLTKKNTSISIPYLFKTKLLGNENNITEQLLYAK